MRLFIAADVGAEVQREAARVIDELKRRAERLAPHARVSWARPERMHLTVRFIGEVTEGVCHTILTALDGPASTAAFDLTVATTGAFPASGRPRVLWAGVTGGLGHMKALEQEVAHRLAPLPLDRYAARSEDCGLVALRPHSGPSRAERGKRHWQPTKGLQGYRGGAPWLVRDGRRYHPHLTLARIKHAAGIRTAALLSGFEHVVLGSVRVEAVTLFESRSSPDGHTYVALGRMRCAESES